MLRKMLVLGAAAALIASLAVQPASAGKKQQVVEGTILLPAPYTDDTGCYAGIHRRGAILSQGNNNGVVGWHFDVDPATVGKKFVLDVAGQGPFVDVDITFYMKFGTAEDVAGDPLNAGSPATYEYHTRTAGGEKGKVPKGFPQAIICMYGGGQGSGVLGDFTYTAG